MSAVSFNVAPELERVRDGLGGGGGCTDAFLRRVKQKPEKESNVAGWWKVAFVDFNFSPVSGFFDKKDFMPDCRLYTVWISAS